MSVRTRGPVGAVAVIVGTLVVLRTLIAGTRAWVANRFRYRLDGFPSAPVPSLRLHLMARVGLASFHSQLGQDKWVLGVACRGVKRGYFVDIGAADACLGSNSLALEEAGWSGICVEPFPTGDWSTRHAKLFEAVLYDEANRTIDFRPAGVHGGIDDHIETWRSDAAAAPVVERTTLTIGELLAVAEAPPHIDYLSLDTEGSEYEILSAFPFERHTIGALTVEHNGESHKRARIRRLLESNGYRFDREHVVEDWYTGPRRRPG